MAVTVISLPAALVDDLEQVKAHLRVNFTDDDAIIDAYLAAACAHIDGPGGWLDRAIGPQTLEWSGEACDLEDQDRLPLPFGPVLSVTSVKYDDADGVEQTFSAASYRLTAAGAVELVDGESWPTLRGGSDAIRIRYEAGYATTPPAVIAAVLLMVGDLYGNRESAVLGPASAVPMSATVEALLAPYKVWSA